MKTRKPFAKILFAGLLFGLVHGEGILHEAKFTSFAFASGYSVYRLLGSDAKKVVTFFASVDPDRDKPSVLKSYLAYFRIDSRGLMGTKDEIDAVVKEYGAKIRNRTVRFGGGLSCQPFNGFVSARSKR